MVIGFNWFHQQQALATTSWKGTGPRGCALSPTARDEGGLAAGCFRQRRREEIANETTSHVLGLSDGSAQPAQTAAPLYRCVHVRADLILRVGMAMREGRGGGNESYKLPTAGLDGIWHSGRLLMG